MYAFGLSYPVRPEEENWSFGLGAFGRLCLIPIVLLILRDPVWETRAAEDR